MVKYTLYRYIIYIETFEASIFRSLMDKTKKSRRYCIANNSLSRIK